MIDFNKMIDNHIAREHKAKEIGRYFPSEIGNCLRKLWYSYKYPQEIEPDLLKIFEVGNIMHGFVTEVLSSDRNKDVKLLQTEFPFKIKLEDFLISGRVDDLVLVNKSGKKLLVEVKSIKDISFVEEPRTNHVTQLMFYMHSLGIHNGLILYVDKNNLQSKIFEIPFDKNRSEMILERFRILHKNLKENKLPLAEAKEIEDINWMCKLCEYKDKCDKNFD